MFQSLQPETRSTGSRAVSIALHAAALVGLWLAPEPFVTPLPELPRAPRVSLVAPKKLDPPPRRRKAPLLPKSAATRYGAPSTKTQAPQKELLAALAPPTVQPTREAMPALQTEPMGPAAAPMRLAAATPVATTKPMLAVRRVAFGSTATTATRADGRVVRTAGFADAFRSDLPVSLALDGRAGFGSTSSATTSTSRVAASASAGFGAARRMEESSAVRAPQTAPASSPIRVLWKPEPQYSAEARSERIEGDVVLLVRFPAEGAVEVIDVVSSLGYGLDEFAIQAAAAIRFEPATQGGVPVEKTARIRIRFELAY